MQPYPGGRRVTHVHRRIQQQHREPKYEDEEALQQTGTQGKKQDILDDKEDIVSYDIYEGAFEPTL